MKKIFVTLLVLGLASAAWGQKRAPIERPLGDIRKVVVRGFKGRIQIVPSETDTLRIDARKVGKVPFDQWKLRVGSKQDTMEVVVKGPAEQEDWDKLRTKQEIPEFEMKLWVPPRELEVFWHSGAVVAQKWKGNLSLQMTEGAIKVEDGEGQLRLQMISGRVQVTNHKGNLDIQSFKGQVVTEQTQGLLSLDNHSAKAKVSKHNGPFHLNNHSGTISMVEVEGASQIRNVTGIVRASGFSGSLTGEIEKGSLSVKAKVVQNFTVNSSEAAITLDAPKESGAQVSLRSEKGHLWVPVYFQKI
ncbi:MAG: hypothetical protein AAF203_08145, partial [Pseudomonadota bacterium]